MKQSLHFIPPDKKVATLERPDRVWTLYQERDASAPPSLPFAPVCRRNAWPEDVIHDWNWRAGILRYYSRVADHGVWILCEYDAPKKGKESK